MNKLIYMKVIKKFLKSIKPMKCFSKNFSKTPASLFWHTAQTFSQIKPKTKPCIALVSNAS